jgi:cytochrome o ubiquinol oxidase subunit 2
MKPVFGRCGKIMQRNFHLALFGLGLLCAAALLGGCSSLVLFDPKGPIGDAQRVIIIVAIGLMLIVVIPVFVMTFLFSRKYRASNTKALYSPKWSYSAKIDLLIWAVPVAIVTCLGILAWTQTHRLNPYSPITPGTNPLRIEAVSLDWKWLFIYPDHHIATVNELVFPAKVPLSFHITSDTVMTSFFIPQLGSQIYAMAGMRTRLHLLADEPGVYLGQNQQFSGPGFSYMNFDAIALPREQFEAWVQKTRQSPNKLDLVRYEAIEKPSIGYPVTYFSSVMPGLFDHILRKYMPMAANPLPMSKESGSGNAENRVSEER